METIIYGSVKELNFYDFDKIRKGEFLRLEEDHLTFYFPQNEEHCKWVFNSKNSVIEFNHSSLEEVATFLEEKGIAFSDLTGRFDVELSFEKFYHSKYKKIIEDCESIDLFSSDLSYTYKDKYCCIHFEPDELARFKSFLIINNIKFRDLS